MELDTRTRHGKQVAAAHTYSITSEEAYTPIDFKVVEERANAFAGLIESRYERIVSILLKYESYEVATDEISRTLDLLHNLKENAKYFRLRTGPVTAFLPRNQPLYAFSCFVIVPALMSSEVHFRIPSSMRAFFPELLDLLEIREQFPNVTVSNKTRLEFLRERSALRVDPQTKEDIPVTDAVIFTGTPAHAEQLRIVFDDRTLFIANGAGHNPIVVGKDANLHAAAEAVLTLQLYNQGQDCAAPNSILVHSEIFQPFLTILRESLRSVKIGHYFDRTCRVGPISDPKDLVRILDFIVRNQQYLDIHSSGIVRPRESILEPTIINKPLREGGNFSEIFAPVMVVQEYCEDSELARYFEDPHYAQHAMYVTVYGTSQYVSKLINRDVGGKILHDESTVKFNTHLHSYGVERGTQPYGGYGAGASSLSIKGKVIAKPTLPQRDIFEWVAKPLIHRKALAARRKSLKRCTQIAYKNIEKLLKIFSHEKQHIDFQPSNITYLDMHAARKRKNKRFLMVEDTYAYHLLESPNAKHIAAMRLEDIEHIRQALALIRRRSKMKPDRFMTELYAIPVMHGITKAENRARQQRFFQDIYQLLLGKKSGPRLTHFLADVDVNKIRTLLSV